MIADAAALDVVAGVVAMAAHVMGMLAAFHGRLDDRAGATVDPDGPKSGGIRRRGDDSYKSRHGDHECSEAHDVNPLGKESPAWARHAQTLMIYG